MLLGRTKSTQGLQNGNTHTGPTNSHDSGLWSICGSLIGCLYQRDSSTSARPVVGKRKNSSLDAKQHICARRDKGILESRFLNSIKGYGVFATAPIEEGSFIVEYRGTLREAGKCIPDAYSYYFIYNNTRYCIDASVDDGSLGRLVNDDSNPNSKMKVIAVSHVPHLCLFALRDIQPGEEITYDYGGYDLPWRRGTWMCMGGPVQFDNDREREETEYEEQPSVSETTEHNTCVGKTPEDIPCNTLTARQPSCEDEQQICENQLPQITDQMQIVVQNPVGGEMTSDNKEASVSVPTDQVTDVMEQMECEKEDINCQPTEQAQLEMAMEVDPCVDEQSLTEATAQTCEDDQDPREDDQDPRQDDQETYEHQGEQKAYEAAQNTYETEPSQNQIAAQHTGSAHPETSEQSSPAEQDACDNELDSNEGVSSDEEFVPESDPESDGDSDVENPVSKASDTSKDVEEEIILPNQNSHIVTQAAKENFCFVCGKASSKIARHLKVHRKDNFEIASAFKLRKSSKERRRILEVLRNRGNYQHNTKVCKNGAGLIKVNRTPRDKIDTQKFEYCMYCKGLYMRKELWRHARRCTSNPERDTAKSARTRILGLAAVTRCPHLEHVSDDVRKMLCDMHQDEVARAVQNDEYVLRLAQYFFDKKGNSKERHEFVRHTLRCIGKFLNILQKKTSIRNLAEAIKPSHFPEVTEAVKDLAEFNKETNSFAVPSLARSIGLTLRKFCILTAEKAYAVQDKRLIEATGSFFRLFDDARSQFALVDKKTHPAFHKPPLLPFVKDVRLFHCYLENAMQCAMQELREKPSAQSYADLSKVTLAQILMFNRRHGDVTHLSIKVFQERDKEQVTDTSDELTEFEKELFKHYCKLEVVQNIRGQATIILTPDMVRAMILLIEKRKQCGVCDGNGFVFGHVKGKGYYRGENALRICANECGAVNPDQLTSTEFSKHIATLTQVLTLKNHELVVLAKFIGHDISVRKEYYRHSEATARLAKICKLILAIEKGSASDLLGQSLDDIELSDEVNESDSEAEDFEDEMIFKRITTSKRCKKDSGSTPKEGAEESQTQVAEEWDMLEEPKRVHKRKPWTKEERLAVVKHFKKHIYHGKLASVKECRRCQELEHPALNGRTTQNIRDFVRNMGISFKRKMTARTHMGTSLVDPTNHVDQPIQAASPNVLSTHSIVLTSHKVNSVSSMLSTKVILQTTVQSPEVAVLPNV